MYPLELSLSFEATTQAARIIPPTTAVCIYSYRHSECFSIIVFINFQPCESLLVACRRTDCITVVQQLQIASMFCRTDMHIQQ